MMSDALPLLTPGEREEARALVESCGLSFEPGCDDVVGIYEDGLLVATAARSGYVLKLFAIDEAHQGGDVLGQLVTALLELGHRAGHHDLFVFTRPEHAGSFQACNFRLLAACGDAALLEHGPGLDAWLRAHEALRRPGSNGAVVVNGNPFTLGHLYLVETAASRVETLYLFVVREDRSVFPFAARYRIASEASSHLRNVVVLDTGRYAISAATFPSYFLRRTDRAAVIQMEIDAHLFGRHLAPHFRIQKRVVGDEPYCETTAAYNDVLGRVLPCYGMALEVVPRIADRTGFVSATRVRAALAAGDVEAAVRMVPAPTAEFLMSKEGAEVARRLAAEARRH